MEQYLIDTNAVSDYLSASLPDEGIEFMDSVINVIPNLSIITQVELLCWNTDSITEQKVQDFIDDSRIEQITSNVISHCISIRKYKKIKTPDALIAATALAGNFTLITINATDFAGIKGLKTINPRKLK